MLEQEEFTWRLIENDGQKIVNSVAQPTATELMFRKKTEQVNRTEKRKMDEMEKRYGTESELLGKREAPVDLKPIAKLMKEDRDQIKVSNAEEVTERLKKETEAFIDKEQNRGGHSFIWGSWWNKELGWGYKCCHGVSKYERCLGEEAKALAILKQYKTQFQTKAN